MFKRLGTFAVLAVCLFALAMVGCNGDDPPITPLTDKPPVELPPPTAVPGGDGADSRRNF